MIVNLTKTEIDHILSLIEDNERDGWYYGPKDQYRKRSNRIKAKLQRLRLKITPKEKIMVTVTVKCVSCGSTKEIKPDEIALNSVPICDKCFMPMLAVKAKSRRRTNADGCR